MANLFKAEWARIQSPQRNQLSEAKMNIRQPARDRCGTNQNSYLNRFNSTVLRTLVEKENRVLTELKIRQQQLAENEKRKYEAMVQYRQAEDLRREQEKICKRKLKTQALTEYQVKQMKERELLKEKERQQDKRDAELLRKIDELHAQEVRREVEKKAESKKINLKNKLEDIDRAQLKREECRMEEQKLELLQKQILLQRKPEQTESSKRFEAQKEMVRDKLAATKKEQAATTALLEEKRFAKEVAKREAELAKQQKEKEKKRSAALQSVSDHRQNVILKKEQKANTEQHSNLNLLQANKEADMSFITSEKLKAQKIKEDRIKLDKANLSLAAKKLARLELLKKEERDSAVRNAEPTAQTKHLQQYVHHDLHKAAENLWCQEQHKFPISSKEPSKVDLRPTCLPPISKTAKATSAARDSTSQWFGLRFSTEGSSYRSADTGEPLPRLSRPKPRHKNPELRYRETTIVDLEQTCLSSVCTVCKLQ
ncbi:cilia- and flagella- associated protein 210-like [Seriola aureovittata]|uniref:cilia- and flagella- associated protein 210-like n=1 Tax=Seriola aureovittata TaxID=2871759 RepID=UPI0024BDEB83|nr:cilia- and flagella- associated protein 210-like [Seriola aureovittata]